jgi:alpha-tubulin suppressor-like RCC1 family protein
MIGVSAAVIAVIPGIVAVAQSSSATPITWLAAGDSYSSGAGLATTTTSCDQADSNPNSEAYASHAYLDLKSSIPALGKPTFVACSGATSLDFIQSPDANGHPEWNSAMGRFDLITFTFGGDDVDFAKIMTQCVVGALDQIFPSDPGHSCPSDTDVRDLIALKLEKQYQTFLTKVANEVVVHGGNIVVLGYPEIIDLPKFWPSLYQHLGLCDGIGTADATQIRGDAGDVNASIGHDVDVVNAEHPNGVTLTFLDVNSGSDPGPVVISKNDPNLFEPSQGVRHNLCGSGPPWLNGLIRNDLHRSYHPTELGNAAEGRLLAGLVPYLPGLIPPVPVTTSTTTSTTTTTTTLSNNPPPPPPAPSIATQISTDNSSACALAAGGTIDCWGDNEYGGLGDGTTTDSSTPVEVMGLTSATEISVGQENECALLSGGTVNCWGYNGVGDLGDGTTADSSTPVAVTGLSGVTQISTNGDTSCALLTGGTVECWGGNEFGALGDGTTTDSSTPVAVTGLSGVTQISVGADENCALLTGGTVDCWGYNGVGELGNGTTTNSSIPVAVTGLSGVSAISSGWEAACALLNAGTVDCWGDNEYGELGIGTTTDSSTPTAVSGLTGVTQISAGGDSACAVLSNGTADCWGENEFGELGNGTTTNSLTPAAVTGLTRIAQIAAGPGASCALLAVGTVDCWGDNASGGLGNGTDSNSSIPVEVSGF